MSRTLTRLLACLVGIGFVAVRYPVAEDRVACGFPLPFCHLRNGYMWGGGQAVVIAPLDFLIGFGSGLFILWGVSTLIGKGGHADPAKASSEQDGDSD